MPTKPINVSIDEKLLSKIDSLVANDLYNNRSRLIEEAIKEKLQAIDAIEIGEQAKLLSPNDSEDWFAEELEAWQEKY